MQPWLLQQAELSNFVSLDGHECAFSELPSGLSNMRRVSILRRTVTYHAIQGPYPLAKATR